MPKLILYFLIAQDRVQSRVIVVLVLQFTVVHCGSLSLLSLASHPYLSFIGTFETVLQGAGLRPILLASSGCRYHHQRLRRFFQYSTLTRRGKGRRFVVYVPRGHCRIGRCVGVRQWEFLIIDVHNELILEF